MTRKSTSAPFSYSEGIEARNIEQTEQKFLREECNKECNIFISHLSGECGKTRIPDIYMYVCTYMYSVVDEYILIIEIACSNVRVTLKVV